MHDINMTNGEKMMNNTQQDFWDANLYDEKHAFVSKYGNDLIELLQPKQGEKVLDLGCGTGDLANVLHGFKVDVTGIDYSENMIAQAQAKYPHIPFYVMDATRLTYENEFDAVFSNATLHWIKTPEAVLQGIFQSLKPGGRLVVEFGGAGNVQTITDELVQQIHAANIVFTDDQFPWYFPTIGQYSALLESVGFHVSYAHHFSRPTKLSGEHGMRNWLEMFSPSLFENVEQGVKNHIFNTTIHHLQKQLYYNNSWYADYKRIRVVAFKQQ